MMLYDPEKAWGIVVVETRQPHAGIEVTTDLPAIASSHIRAFLTQTKETHILREELKQKTLAAEFEFSMYWFSYSTGKQCFLIFYCQHPHLLINIAERHGDSIFDHATRMYMSERQFEREMGWQIAFCPHDFPPHSDFSWRLYCFTLAWWKAKDDKVSAPKRVRLQIEDTILDRIRLVKPTIDNLSFLRPNTKGFITVLACSRLF